MRAVFFDFDGTLAETSRGIINGYRHAFLRIGMPVPPEDTIRRNIGPPLKEVLAALVPAAPADTVDELAAHYREYFSSEGLFELEFFAGIPEMLEQLSEKNVRLAIISSKPEVFIERILERYGYGKYFAHIDGLSLGFNNRPKGERLKGRIVAERLDPNDCVVVGDRAEDMKAARFCGTGFIGVLFGYGDEEELKGAAVVRNVKELKDSLIGWTEGRT